jgi:sugar phosphate isomerase/epimerase
MDRRSFVHTLGAALVAPAVACAMPRAGAATSRRLGRVGLQLYTLRDAARVNLEQTLAEIAAIGYKDVELLMSMNNFNTPPAQVRAMLDRHGLRAPSTHIGENNLDQLDRAADDARILGHKYLILANLPDDARKSLDGFTSWADKLNRAGEAVRKHDLWLGFHDEAPDFVAFDGKVGYDALVERLDPNLVRLQLDVGNAAQGGRDPRDLMNRYGTRYWAFHIKDVPAMKAEHDTELGKGVLDLRALLARITDIDDKLVYVEQESYPGAPIDSVRRDYEYLSTLRF